MQKLENIDVNSLKIFIKYTPAAVAMFDNNMKYIAASDRWYSDYNIDDKNITGKCHYDIFPEIREIPQWLNDHQNVLSGKIISRDRDYFQRKDGSHEWLKYTLLPWYDKNDKIGGMMMYTETITKQIDNEIELEKLNDELECKVKDRTTNLEQAVEQLSKSNDELERFAYVASHDLREPIRSISSCAQLLSGKYYNQLDDKARKIIGLIIDNSNKAEKLVSDLLSYSKLAKNILPFSKVDLNVIVDYVVGNLNQSIKESNAKVIYHSLPTIEADNSQMIQLFQNMIENAIKYVDQGTKPIIQITSEKVKGSYQIVVEDNGIGIAQENLEQIFTIFTRLHTSKIYTGTGIGLATVKRIINNHKGSIKVESKEGEGTKFIIALPA